MDTRTHAFTDRLHTHTSIHTHTHTLQFSIPLDPMSRMGSLQRPCKKGQAHQKTG